MGYHDWHFLFMWLLVTSKNFQNDNTYSPAATRKRNVTRDSAADTFDLQEVSDGVHGCVQFGANGPDLHRYWST